MTIDFILVRRSMMGRVKNSTVIPGESIATQHRILMADMSVKKQKEKRRERPERIRWWKLKETEGEQFVEKLRENIIEKLENEEATWENTCVGAVELAKEELGVSNGGKYLEKESRWWNNEVQEAVARKKEAFKIWKTTRREEDGEQRDMAEEEYKKRNKEAKIEVAKAKEKAYEKMYKDLEENGAKNLYKLAKTRKRRSLDIDRMKFVKNGNGDILSQDEDIKQRWQEYFDELLNTRNKRDELGEADAVEGPIAEVTQEEVKKQMEKMKTGKATGPDAFPIEIVKRLGDEGISWMTAVMRDIQKTGIPTAWRQSRITPLYKQKGDPLNCSNYRGIKLLSHCLKLWERIIEGRLRDIVQIAKRQYGFQKGKSTTEPMFCLRMLQEKMREYQQDLHMVFVDLEKAYDTVPRDLIWYCLRKRGVPEVYVELIRDMYRDCTTSVNTSTGTTEAVRIEVGLHQGSALSPFLFIVIMDTITEEIEEAPPWAMLFADDLVLCDKQSQGVEERLEKWRDHLEGAGLKLSRTKTEYLPPAGDQRKIKLKSHSHENLCELPETTTFKYLGTTIDQEGGCGAEVKRRIGVAWDRWRDLSGVMCDKKVPTKLKVLLYKTSIKPTLTYGSETWPVTQRMEEKLNATEMRMLRHIHGVTFEDHITNEEIRSQASVRELSIQMRVKRLRWYGHVCRRDEDEDIRRVMEMKVTGRRKRGRPKQRWTDTIRTDMRCWDLEKADTQDRERWYSMIQLGACRTATRTGLQPAR